MKSIDEGATLERKVAFLLQRDQDAQRDVGALEKRVTAAEQTSVERLDELRGDMETHVSTELATSAAEYRAVRIVGAIAVVIGLGLSTAANFLG